MVWAKGAVAIVALAATTIAGASPRKSESPPPITTMRSPPVAPVVAQTPTEKFGDWTVSGSGGVYLARSENNAGAVLVGFCDKSTCTMGLNSGTTCEPGEKYPALVNAPAAAYPLVMECEKVGERLVYSFPLEGAIADAMSVGGVIGFALPMASGEFKVVRFSLTGAARAIARAQQVARKEAEPEHRQPASDNSVL